MEAPERVLPAGPLGTEEGQGQLGHLRIEVRPQRLAVGDHVEDSEPVDVGRVYDLDVGDVVTKVVMSVRVPGRLERVECLAHAPITDCVNVHLEAVTIEEGDVAAQGLRIDVTEAGVARRASVFVQVGQEHGRGEVLADPVLHDLHGPGAEMLQARAAAPLLEQRQLLLALLAVPPQCTGNTAGQQAALGRRHVRVKAVGNSRVVPDDRLLP